MKSFLRKISILLVILLIVISFSCENTTSTESDSNSGSKNVLSAPSVTLYSSKSGEVFFMMPIDSVSVGDPVIEYWVYYNTDGTDTKNYFGVLSSDRTIKNLQSGLTLYFFVRKYCDGEFSPFSTISSIKVK